MWGINPRSEQLCCVCMFSHPDLKDKTSGAKYHEECYEEAMREFHKPPERLVPMNRSKD